MTSSHSGDQKQAGPAEPNVEWVYQFLIVLLETERILWRRIQVPTWHLFRDLHFAIQDAMGWEDRYFHEFRIVNPHCGQVGAAR